MSAPGDSARPARLSRADFPVFRPIQTRWMDNDIYGHVNNVVYYSWLDTAVNGWLIEQGLLDIGTGTIVGLVVETGCAYFESIAFPDEVEVGLRVSRIGRSAVTYETGAFRAGGSIAAAQGRFVHVYVARDTRRPVDLPGHWRDALGAILRR